MTQTVFERDIAAQPEALRDVLAWYTGEGRERLQAARELAQGASRVVMVGMGSSAVAAIPAAILLAAHGTAYACEAGDLLHYGDIPADAFVVVSSQSGRSVETLAVAERLAAQGQARICAVTNDPDSPMAACAHVILPILAGAEATVSTKTFLNTLVVLRLLAAALDADSADVPSPPAIFPADLAADVATAAGMAAVAEEVAARMADCVSLSLVGRGPSAIAAGYGALILKESVAMPCEAFSGGSFRHGPLETAGPALGVVVLAPSGQTHELGIRLALDTSQLGSPTWLIGDESAALPPSTDRLRVTTLPAVDEALAPILSSVLIQRLAAALARQRGRVPGILLRSSKVTETE